MYFAKSFAAVGAALFFGGQLQAGVIQSTNAFLLPGFSTGTLGPVGATPAPNNDNTASADNVIPSTVFINSPGIVELEFNVADSGGTTEYRFNQTLININQPAWKAFRFELGYGTGANFVSAAIAGALDFDVPDLDPAPTSSHFANLASQGNRLFWSQGTVAAVGVASFSLSVDVPDNLADLNPTGVSRFTIRQTPLAAVPETGTVSLFMAGLAALLGFGVRRSARERAEALE